MSAGEAGTASSGCPGAARTSWSPAFSALHPQAQLLLPKPLPENPSHNRQNGGFSFAVPSARNASAHRLLSYSLPAPPASRNICKNPVLSKPLTRKTSLASAPTALCPVPVVRPFHWLSIRDYCLCTTPPPHTHVHPVMSQRASNKPPTGPNLPLPPPPLQTSCHCPPWGLPPCECSTSSGWVKRPGEEVSELGS